MIIEFLPKSSIPFDFIDNDVECYSETFEYDLLYPHNHPTTTTKMIEHNKHIEATWSTSFLLKNKKTKENQSNSLGQISMSCGVRQKTPMGVNTQRTLQRGFYFGSYHN